MSAFEESDGARRVAEELWLKVLNDFDNEVLHQKFIDYCTATHQLPLAGKKYKAYREEKVDSPLIDKYMKKIVISAQFQYLPNREKRSTTKKGISSRLFTSALLLTTGSSLIVLWVSFPVLRNFILMILVIFLGYAVYRVKGKMNL